MLKKIELCIRDDPLPAEVLSWIIQSRQAVEAYQDVWDRNCIEQFVAADYELVYRALREIIQRKLATGRRFCEWGCGFGVITLLAASLKLDAIGIEAESELLGEAKKLAMQWPYAAEFIHGNFLMPNAQRFADDPTLPSLSHREPPAYRSMGLEIEDFAIVYGYPWPGEEFFFEAVFDAHAAPGSLLLLFCGAYDIRLMRKHFVASNRSRSRS